VSQRSGHFTGTGGLRIYWQAWLPAERARGVIVIAHGVSEHSDRYAHVAKRLTDEGYAVYAIDHRGHGNSEGPRALIDRVSHATNDLDTLVAQAAQEHPGVPVFLLGHSMGGALAVSYAMRHQERLNGLILSGPLAALEAAPAHQRVMARVLSVIAPGLPLFPIDAKLISRDPGVVEAYVSDPRVYHGKLPVRTVAELASSIDTFPQGAGAITIPTLIMYGTADQLCPPEGSEMLARNIGSADVEIKPYEGLYHEILNEPEQGAVLDDMCSWLAARAAPVTQVPS
jgi:alpha-beta hydrolase superfamily lysophospholipase